MFDTKLAKELKKVATNTMITTFFARHIATLFMFQKNKINNYNLKH